MKYLGNAIKIEKKNNFYWTNEKLMTNRNIMNSEDIQIQINNQLQMNSGDESKKINDFKRQYDLKQYLNMIPETGSQYQQNINYECQKTIEYMSKFLNIDPNQT